VGPHIRDIRVSDLSSLCLSDSRTGGVLHKYFGQIYFRNLSHGSDGAPNGEMLTPKSRRYLTRQVLGWRSYSWLTGRNEEDEIARVRAWEIAIDAQLAGGDSEMSRSRLVLTLWASGTLPVTPARRELCSVSVPLLIFLRCVPRGISKETVLSSFASLVRSLSLKKMLTAKPCSNAQGFAHSYYILASVKVPVDDRCNKQCW
jgi:hypothetical protein